MTRTFLLFLLLAAYSASVWAQQSTIVSGMVSDGATSNAIPFVNIGLKKHALGTVSSETGAFSLHVPATALNDTVVFSCMGYAAHKVAVSQLKKTTNHIRLQVKSILLSEVLARPLTVEEYLRIAISRIPDNYANTPSLARGHYYELTTENDNFLKFEEAVTSTYFPAYGDTVKSHSSILHGRSLDELATIQFMQAKMNRKLKRAQKRDKDYEPAMDAEDLTSGTSGPSEILGSDPIHQRPTFLDPKEFKHFKFKLDGIVPYGDHQLLNIHFRQKQKVDHEKSEGNIYIDADSYAFVAIEYEGKFIIPALLKPVIALAGIGISNPRYHTRVHYRVHDGKWYVASAHQDITIKLSTTDLFHKNDHSVFREEQAYVVESLQTTDVQPIPKGQRVKTSLGFEEQALIQDPAFWETYTPVRPIKLAELVD